MLIAMKINAATVDLTSDFDAGVCAGKKASSVLRLGKRLRRIGEVMVAPLLMRDTVVSFECKAHYLSIT